MLTTFVVVVGSVCIHRFVMAISQSGVIYFGGATLDN